MGEDTFGGLGVSPFLSPPELHSVALLGLKAELSSQRIGPL